MNPVLKPLIVLETYLLYLILFSLPLQSAVLVPGTSLTIVKVAGVLLIAVVVVRRLSERQWPFGRVGVEAAIVVFALASVAAAVMADDRTAAMAGLIGFGQLALIFYAVATSTMSHGVHGRVAALYIGGAAISGVMAGLAMLGWGVTPTVDVATMTLGLRRVCVGHPDSNEHAMFLVFAVALLLFSPGLWRGRWRMALCSIAGAGIVCGLVLTMSRTGWGLCVALGAARVLSSTHRVRYALAGLGVVAAFVAVAWLVAPGMLEPVQRRIAEGAQGGDLSTASRVVHFTDASALAWRGGLFGYGPNAALPMARALTDPLGRPIGTTVHNVPIIIWLELGLLGLVAWAWLWSSVLGQLVQGYRRAHGDDAWMIGAYAAVALVYGAFCLFMPFVQLTGLAVLAGCAMGAVQSVERTPVSRRDCE